MSVLDQVYTRTFEREYANESGSFPRVLTVNEDGLVLDYPGLWQAEAVFSVT